MCLADALVYVVPRGDLAEIPFAQRLPIGLKTAAPFAAVFGIIRHAVCGDENQSQKAGNFGFQMECVGGYELYDDN